MVPDFDPKGNWIETVSTLLMYITQYHHVMFTRDIY